MWYRVLYQNVPGNLTICPYNDLYGDEELLPLLYIIADILSQIWACPLTSIRAALEAGINIMQKSRFNKAAETLINMINLT